MCSNNCTLPNTSAADYARETSWAQQLSTVQVLMIGSACLLPHRVFYAMPGEPGNETSNLDVSISSVHVCVSVHELHIMHIWGGAPQERILSWKVEEIIYSYYPIMLWWICIYAKLCWSCMLLVCEDHCLKLWQPLALAFYPPPHCSCSGMPHNACIH